MLRLPIFDPSRPPPPTHPGLFDPLADEQFVQHFVSAIGVSSKTVGSVKLSEAKSKLVDIVNNIEQLTVTKDALQQQIESSSDANGNSSIEQIEQIQKDIESKLIQLNDPNFKKALKRKLHARSKKRAWQKRRNACLKAERQRSIVDRKHLNDRIDKWQRERQQLLEEEKQLQQQLSNASQVLADVRRRKAACKRYLAKFEKMKQMKSRQSRVGESSSTFETDKEFDAEIARLTQIWTKKLTDCVKEENLLKDTLARKSEANFKRRVENEWNKTLFGDTIPKRFEHPLLGADRDPQVLIANRRIWDACLVADDCEGDDSASGIPLGWVLPPHNPLPEWKQYQIA